MWACTGQGPGPASWPGLWLLIGSIKTQVASHQGVMEDRPHLSEPTKVLGTLATGKAATRSEAHPRNAWPDIWKSLLHRSTLAFHT